MSPMVSIIIGNYNYGRFLGACINSALAQSYGRVEIVIVDDGSTDNSREILLQYKDRVRIIFQKNGGQAAVFNSGFRACSGDLILFLDSDDLLMSNAAEVIAKQWRSDFSKAHFRMRVINDRGIPQPFCMPRAELSCGRLDREIADAGRSIAPPTSGNVYARWLLERILPMPESEWSEGNDGYLNAHAAFAGPILRITPILGYYRVHSSSMSAIEGNGRIDVQKLRTLLDHDLRESRLIQGLAQAHGVSLARQPVISHWTHLKLRLAWARLGGADLFARDFVWRVLRRMLQSLWTAGFPLAVAERDLEIKDARSLIRPR